VFTKCYLLGYDAMKSGKVSSETLVNLNHTIPKYIPEHCYVLFIFYPLCLSFSKDIIIFNYKTVK
jgi:hypothetical protein